MNSNLPPGPWDSKGNKLVTGNGQTIATVFYPRNASQIAEALSKFPDLLEELEELRERVAEMEQTDE